MGVFRDGAKLLEKLVFAAQGKEITTTLLEEKYKPSGGSAWCRGVIWTYSPKTNQRGTGVITRVVDQGIDIRMFIQQLLQALDQQLLHKYGCRREKNRPLFYPCRYQDVGTPTDTSTY